MIICFNICMLIVHVSFVCRLQRTVKKTGIKNKNIQLISLINSSEVYSKDSSGCLFCRIKEQFPHCQ